MKKGISSILCALLFFLAIGGCGSSTQAQASEYQAQANESVDASESEAVSGADAETWEVDLDRIDMTKWQYDSGTDVYWQVGISYCANPADEEYETLGIFVPGAYMDAADNGDGTYTCTVNKQGEVNGYTSETAPILFPVNTPGHKAQDAPE